jgi:hypothetical protein
MPRAFFFLLVLAVGCGSSAVDPCSTWRDLQWGTALDDEALAVATAKDAVLVAGHRGGRLDESNIGPTGDARGYVRALAPSGELRWETQLDTAGADAAEAVAIGTGGAVAVAGRTTGAFAGASNAGQFDAFVARLDPSGRILDVRQWGDERPQHPRRLSLRAGEAIVGGYDDVFVPSNFVMDWENPFAARLTAGDAAPSLQVTYRTAHPDTVDGLALAPDGSAIYLAGTNVGGAQPGVWVRKLAADGSEIWGARLSASALDSAAAVLLTARGELLLASTRIEGGTGTSDPVLQSLDVATGAPLWTHRYLTATASEFVRDLAVDSAGNLYLAGWATGSLDAAAPGKGGADFFAVKTDPRGERISSWQGGTAGDDFAFGVAIDSCGRALLAGSTDGVLAGATSAGRRDAVLVKAFAD